VNNSGQAAGFLYITAPIWMGLASLLGWEPFSNMPWLWITSPWWYLMLLVFTVKIARQVWYAGVNTALEEKKRAILEEDANKESKKDLH